MCPDLSDLLQQYLAMADRADVLLLVNAMLLRAGEPMAERHRRALGQQFRAFLDEGLGRAQARQRAYAELTDREIEVLELLAAGCSNQGIADLLAVSERTVRQHQHNIQHKLGVTGRGRLVAKVYGLDGLCNGSAETTMP